MMRFFCWAILVNLTPAKVFLVFLHFLLVFPQNAFSPYIFLAVAHHFLPLCIFPGIC